MAKELIDDLCDFWGWYFCGITEDTCYPPPAHLLPIRCLKCPCISVCHCVEYAARKRRESHHQRLLARRIPKALPELRKRSLTLTRSNILAASTTLDTLAPRRLPWRKQPIAVDQTSRSPFFRLSPELRRMVYREIFQEDQVIHVVVLQPEARMGHVRCTINLIIQF